MFVSEILNMYYSQEPVSIAQYSTKTKCKNLSVWTSSWQTRCNSVLNKFILGVVLLFSYSHCCIRYTIQMIHIKLAVTKRRTSSYYVVLKGCIGEVKAGALQLQSLSHCVIMSCSVCVLLPYFVLRLRWRCVTMRLAGCCAVVFLWWSLSHHREVWIGCCFLLV